MRLDIAPFAYREEDASGDSVTLRWEEPRDLHRVMLRFADSGQTPRPGDIEIAYWKSHWPQVRVSLSDFSRGAIGGVGWAARDDWFNGEWKRADVTARAKDGEITFAFAPLGRREFPELQEEYNVRFRTAVKLRVRVPEGSARIGGIRVYTNSVVQTRRIAVELGCGQQQRSPWDGVVKVYNGTLHDLAPPNADDPRLRLRVACAQAGVLSADHTVVTVRTPSLGVSFRPEDLDRGAIWVRDLGVLVTDTRSNLRYSPLLASRLVTGMSCYDRILQQPEQGLKGAMRGQQPKEPMHFIVGCEGARQKFGVAPNGDIFTWIGYIREVQAGDTPRVGWEDLGCALRFGWDDWLPNGRRLVNGYLPLLEAAYTKGALDVQQDVFATPLDQSILSGPIAGDAVIACLCRLTFRNNGPAPLSVAQPFRVFGYQESVGGISRNTGKPTYHEHLRVDKDEVLATFPKTYFRMLVDTRGRGELVQAEGDLSYRLELGPGESHAIVLKIPFLSLLSAEEISRLRGKDFDHEREEVIEYWKRRIAPATEVVTPEPDINDFSRAILTHILINDDHEVGSDRIMGRVSSFHYGNFSNETIMQVMELDRRGYHQEARRHLDTFLHYQGTRGLPGNFQSKEGIFYGSGGYECGDYNQHHGWVLWGLAEHYRFTGDRDWLAKIADKLIAGCDWVIGERQATMRTDATGGRTLEYGFLPAGSLEDVTDFCYWLTTNCLTYRGLEAAAEALADIGHPDGARLAREAKAYREDLLAGFRESMVRSAVVRLRDGTYVPSFPVRLYLRGRDFGWIRNVLEGAIWLTTTVLDPCSQESTWIMKDFEDNLYLDAPYNYPLEDFEREWFSRGGFSMQPNLVYSISPHLLRDHIEHFLRAYFNAFAATFRRDIRAMAEHALPTLVEWEGDHFKTSDEAMSSLWLRTMFIQEDGDTLYLGRGLPRAWVGSEHGVAIRRAATYFGPMSFELRTLDDGARIVASIDPPTRRPPQKVVVRFRHASKARLIGVVVNGEPFGSTSTSLGVNAQDRPVGDLDGEREWVVLPGLSEPTTVEAHFSPPL